MPGYTSFTYPYPTDANGMPTLSTKAISSFNFNSLSPTVTGTVDENAHTVSLTVPYGTNVTSLSPTISITGASVSPSSGSAQNFTNPVTYTVTASDSSTQAYTVTVTVSAAPVSSGGGGGGGGSSVTTSSSSGGGYSPYYINQSSLINTPQKVSEIPQNQNVQYVFTKNISVNTYSPDIKALQQFLNRNGYIISKTGPGSLGNETNFFGTLTFKALVRFQKSVGLPATGYFGPMTRNIIKNSKMFK
jgi:hypothetical protein